MLLLLKSDRVTILPRLLAMVLLESFWLTETVLQEAITKTLEAKARHVASLDVLKLLCINRAIINDLDNKTVMFYLFK